MADNLAPQHKPSNDLSIGELLQLRHQLVEDHHTELLRKLDEQLRDLATSNPDRAADMFDALAASAEHDDRDAAAIYIKPLFATLPDRAKSILRKLLQDSNEDIRTTAFDTLEELIEHDILTADEGAQFAHVFRTANTPTA